MSDKITIGLRVTKKNYEAYKKYCDQHGLKYSYLIDRFMGEQK